MAANRENSFKTDALTVGNLKNSLTESADGDLVFKDSVVTAGVKLKELASSTASKADKVVGAIAGNLAGLDITGNLTDSGINPSTLSSNTQLASISGNLYSIIKNTSASLQEDIDNHYSILVETSGNLYSLIHDISSSIVPESTIITSSGGSISVSQNGSSFNLEVASAPISNHNDLLGLQGDGIDYFHLNNTQFASISGGIDLSDYTLLSTTNEISGTLYSLITTSSGSYSGTAERTVGGFTEGVTYSNLNLQQFGDMLLKEEKFPILTAPSSTFTSNQTGYKEVGEILSITFTSTFNRGSISPQYTAASPYRSGLPNTYEYIGTGLSNQSSTSLTDIQSISAYTVLINGQSWQGRVAYDGGVQPKSSYGNNYNSPLSAGNSNYTTRTITGVYPYFGTTVDIATRTQQTLTAHNATYYQFSMVSEGGSDKQTAWFSTSHSTITGVQFYNTISSAWEWLTGDKTGSLALWTVTSTTISIQGNTVNYNKYTHNGSLIGARQLRFYTT